MGLMCIFCRANIKKIRNNHSINLKKRGRRYTRFAISKSSGISAVILFELKLSHTIVIDKLNVMDFKLTTDCRVNLHVEDKKGLSDGLGNAHRV